jgi:hypothetical protein
MAQDPREGRNTKCLNLEMAIPDREIPILGASPVPGPGRYLPGRWGKLGAKHLSDLSNAGDLNLAPAIPQRRRTSLAPFASGITRATLCMGENSATTGTAVRADTRHHCACIYTILMRISPILPTYSYFYTRQRTVLLTDRHGRHPQRK